MPDRFGLPDYVEKPRYNVLQLPVDRCWSIAEYAIAHILTKGCPIVPMEDGLGLVTAGTIVKPVDHGSWLVTEGTDLFILPYHEFHTDARIENADIVRFNEPDGWLTRRYVTSDGMEADATPILLDADVGQSPVVNTTLAYLLRDHAWMVRRPKGDRTTCIISLRPTKNKKTHTRIDIPPGHYLARSDTEGLQVYHPAAFAALFKRV